MPGARTGLRSIKAFGVEQADETPQHPDKGEPYEVSRVGEVVTTREAEQRREPDDRAEDDVADERCDEARQQSRRVKVVPVEDLACQYCSPRGAPKMAPMPDPIPVTTAMRASAG